MARIETGKQTRFSSMSYQVKTPDGTMYVFVMMDSNRKPVGIQINLGKAGTAASAWANATSRVCSLALDHGAHITELIAEFSSQATDRVTFNKGVAVRSGPEGVAIALMRFMREQNGEAEPESESESETAYRAPRLGLRKTGS